MRKDMTSKLLLTGLAAFGTAQIAEAGTASSYAYLEIENFNFSKADETPINPNTDFAQSPAASTTADSSASLNGTTVENLGVSGLDAPMSIIGADTGDLTNAGPRGTFADQNLTESFSRGDTDGSGSVLTGANARTVAETDLVPITSGQAGSKLDLNVNFRFETDQGFDAKVSFDAIWERLVSIDSDLTPGSVADASTNYSVVISNLTNPGNKVLSNNQFTGAGGSDIGDDINTGISLTTPGFTIPESGSDSFEAFFTLDANTQYELTIDHGTSTEGVAVPSPTAAFAGLLGLAGLGMRRRRSSK